MANKKIWKKSELRNIGLNTDDIEYLSEHGIEEGNYGCVDVLPDFEFNSGVVLAYDNGIPIVSSENGNGVFSLEGDSIRFVNSNTEKFFHTITRFKLYCEQVEDIDDEEQAMLIVNSAINDMKHTDEHAWARDGNYWPIIGQQMIEGNL